MEPLEVQTNIKAPIGKVWACWTLSEHIQKWNFASPDWHCPKAENNLVVGGEFHYLMAAKDGSFSFDFWGTYHKIEENKLIEIALGDGRNVTVAFKSNGSETGITEKFDPESVNPIELQKTGWQLILDNFRQYVESLEVGL
jgi:uncharacterized protein YndB with AHSA1/START domain